MQGDDFVVVPHSLKICEPWIIGNVTSIWPTLHIYKQLRGGMVGINCTTDAMILILETGRVL